MKLNTPPRTYGLNSSLLRKLTFGLLALKQINSQGCTPIMDIRKKEKELRSEEIDRVIEMAWEDRTPFGAIKFQFNLGEEEVIALMRRHMKPSSFRMWRKRVQGRATKHRKKRKDSTQRFRSANQSSS